MTMIQSQTGSSLPTESELREACSAALRLILGIGRKAAVEVTGFQMPNMPIGPYLYVAASALRRDPDVLATISFVVCRPANAGRWDLSGDHSVSVDIPACFDRAYRFWGWNNAPWMAYETPVLLAERIRRILAA